VTGAQRSLRVVMLLENYAYPADVRVRNEGEALARAGHRVTVIAPRGEGEPANDTIAGVAVRRFRLPETPDTVAGITLEYAIAHAQLYARGIWELVRGADVVHLHNPPDTLFGVALVARLLGRKAVYDHHDLGPELFEAKFGAESRLVSLLRRAQRRSVRSVDVAIATNESQRELLAGMARSGTRVVVVRNGPRQATLAETSAARGGVLDDPRLVFLGTLGSQDGVDRLPVLMQALAGDHGLPGATLTVIGDGPRAAPLAEAFRAAGVADRVDLRGWVPHADVPRLLAEADICLDPAECTPLNHRSTMIKISEYLAAHRPVVAHELLETRFTAGDAALYVPCQADGEMAAQVARLAGDPDLRRSLAAKAAERVPELVWERSEENLVTAYDRLARAGG
jgi:glycosyltransferase involved in cell wall biosynthesis